MAYGKLKADTLTYDNSGSDADVTISSLAGKVDSASPTFTGDVTLNGSSSSAVGNLILKEASNNGSHKWTIKSPTSLDADYVLTLPANDGGDGEFLKTDGSGVLSWAADATTDSTKLPIDGSGVMTGNLVFEGSTDDAHETTLTVADPTAARTITLPNATGTAALLQEDQEWTGAQRSDITTATHSSGTDYDFDLTATNCHKLTISAGVKLGFSNTANAHGTSGTIEVVNSGSTVPTWATEVYFAGGTSKAPTITASGTTVLAYYCFDTNKVLVEGMSDVKNTA